MNAPDPLPITAEFGEAYFNEVASALDALLAPGESYAASWSAEHSAFVRLNRGKVRQPGSVDQCYLDLDLAMGARHASHRMTLCGDLDQDRAALASAIARLREIVPLLPDDPHLLHPDTVTSTRSARGNELPPADAIVDSVLAAAPGLDLVGLYAGGPMMRGFANSLGQRNWHEATAFNLQWSLYHRGDKAVKSALSGFAWDPALLAARMEEAKDQLGAIALPPRVLEPGPYRAYLTPAAMEEVLGMLQWGAFSARALATHQSSLARMQRDGLTLDPRVHISEAVADGIAPGFQGAGFIRPDTVSLIEAGRLVGALTSPRTAREFGGSTNGAGNEERPEALAMRGGELPHSEVLRALDTGLYVSNLWYLNYSDRPACRITGMTRFATFWVEGGKVVAPVNVLRFDDTLYRMLGDNLEALTRETELRLESNTYGERMLSSVRVPGALLRELTFTL